MTPQFFQVNRTTTVICLCAFVFAVGVMLAHRPWSQIEVGDEAIWDYIAQSIVRGQVPYRDIVEIKTPLSAYLGALAIVGGKLLGLRDVIAIRALHVVLVGLLSAITFLVGERYLKSRLVAVIALLIPLASWHFAEWMAAGTEPKLSMTLFGMLALWLFSKDKPFWAGFCSMLACLCWQPGLLFTGAIVLGASKYLTSWRDGRAVKVLAGAALPLAILLLYFFSVRALRELWDWTIRYNYDVYAPQTRRGYGDSLIHLWRVLLRVFRSGIVLVVMSAIGLVMFGVERMRGRWRKAPPEAGDWFSEVLLIPPLVYLAFCVVNFQSGPDLIPFFPFIGLFAGWFVVDASRLLDNWLLTRNCSLRLLPRLAPALVVVLILGFALRSSVVSAFEHRPKLKDQDAAFKVVSSRLANDDRIYVHGTTELLVLLNRTNMNPYLFLDRGKDDYIGWKLGGGFERVIDQMESLAPRVVALSRLAKVVHRADLEEWVSTHYDELDVPGYDGIYIRKEENNR
jgi:hypothetical protein